MSNSLASASYQKLLNKRQRVLWLLASMTLICFITDISVGKALYSPWQIWSSLWNEEASTARLILLELRLPVALTAIVVGAGLSVSGIQMQTVLNNPLASPFTLGLSSAAAFGAAVGLVLGVSFLPKALLTYAIPLNAFVISMLTAFFIFKVSQKRGMSTAMIVLLGTTLVFSFNALLEALQYIAPDQALSAVVFWTMGNLAHTSWIKLLIMSLVLIICFILFARQAWALTALRLGESRAVSLGVNVEKLRLSSILLSSLLAATCVAFVGTIGFIGLVAPHIARLLIGDDQRFLLPASALSGAFLLSAASILSKTLIQGQTLPIGIVTSLVGVPLFLHLIFRRSY